MYILPNTITEDITNYGNLIEEFIANKIEPVKFKATRVPMGIYEQRKDDTFMVRIRCSAGHLSPFQLRQVAEIGHKYQNDLFHITTRQEIQIQNIKLRDTLLILNKLKEIGLATKGGGGNTVRNIMVSIDSGIAKDDIFDVTSYAHDLTTKLIAEHDSFTLPRKFKISFSASERDGGYAAVNDLGFIAKIKDGKRGFRVLLGGSLGSNPMIGYELFDFAPEEDLYYIADAAKKLFSRYGNRKNRHKARLRYVFYKLGKKVVFQHFFDIYNEIKKIDNQKYTKTNLIFKKADIKIQPEIVASKEFTNWKSQYVSEQQQNDLYSVILPFENGNISYSNLIILTYFIEQFGDDVLRFSMRQNIHLRNIPSNYLGNLFNLIAKIGINTNEALLLNNIVACTGADTCRLGLCLAKGANAALKKTIAKSNLPLEEVKNIKINISGCPNSCGQQAAADLGFYGKVSRNDRMYPAYHIVAGAKIGTDVPQLAEWIGEINARDLPNFTTDLLSAFVSKKAKYNSFSQYIHTEGKKDIETITLKYKNIPSFSDDKNYYFDWGAESIFSLVNKGLGECSAGLFDMIDLDLNIVNSSIENLNKTNNNHESNDLLHKILFSSARMLLVTRGVEPKNETEIYKSFIEKFIDVNLISPIYREIVELSLNNVHQNFTDKKAGILNLAQAVIKLYESMDDSLQFKIDYEEKDISISIASRKKDLRGVVCPLNFVKTKIELSSMKSGDLLEVLLDDGEPIENVPGSIINEGHKVLEQKKIENYWFVKIEKV